MIRSVPRSLELERILALPRRAIDLASADNLTARFRRSGGTAELWPIQSAALAEIACCRGGFFPIGVGWGKTVISLLAGAALGVKRPLILVEPSLRGKLLDHDIPFWSQHFEFPTPQVVAYSELSSAGKADILDRLQPDLVVADEAHNLKRKQSARTKRFLRYFKEHSGVAFVALSGTMTARSIKDYAHLIELALGEGSPLPRSYHELNDWADAIDCSPMNFILPGALKRLCEPGEELRSGFRRRLTHSPGVVATEEGALGTSLYLHRHVMDVAKEVSSALNSLRKTWTIGDEALADNLSFLRVAKQLASGFYYRWAWPEGVKDHEWLEARSEWNRQVRHFLTYSSKPGLDSPFLVAHAVARGERDGDLRQAWESWQRVSSRPCPPVETVWISDALLEDALKFAGTLENCIVWYEDVAIENALRGRIPTFGGGPVASKALLELDASKYPRIACSIKAHGTGKNLQAWSNNLILSPPSSGKVWEQLLGRCHRPGQTADAVHAYVYLHTPELEGAMESALASARYIQETQGQKQKLLYADKVL